MLRLIFQFNLIKTRKNNLVAVGFWILLMIKIIAFTTMFLDHIGVLYFPDILFFRIVGRLSFPLFAWGIARGYRYTKNFKAYAIRLFVIALISQLPYSLLFNNGNMNVCFTLLIGLLSIKLYDSTLAIWIKWPGILLLLAFSHYLRFDYGIYGILTILLFFHFWGNDSVIYYQAGLTLASTLLFRYDPVQLVAILSPLIIFFTQRYDCKLSLSKVLQYSFYPLHMIVLVFIKKGGLL